ncbi:hypothetical protein [Pseudomonas coronafaciens]|uniref:hypothetical protein n=1 Tax=Pseudomonas coronafaciens TaxID=53409 RepID=UPI001604DF55|nr:hypothetical protein [Pseudomonas coronafaciens]
MTRRSVALSLIGGLLLLLWLFTGVERAAREGLHWKAFIAQLGWWGTVIERFTNAATT